MAPVPVAMSVVMAVMLVVMAMMAMMTVVRPVAVIRLLMCWQTPAPGHGGSYTVMAMT
jgi:hypothetical protein